MELNETYNGALGKTVNETLIAITMISGMGKKSVAKFVEEISITPEMNLRDLYDKLTLFAKDNKRVKMPSIEQLKRYKENAFSIIQKQKRVGIDTISIYDDAYPKNYLCLSDKPVVIFAKGDLSLLNAEKHTAIIGTRDITAHGVKAGERLSKILSEHGEIIVSGLAVGCDTCGHRGCLDAGGKTIAILPSPIDNILPRSNEHLAEEIVEKGGLLLSEYYTGTPVKKGYYVERDRLQSGLSDGVVVIETDVTGGTMHTVEFCEKQGKLLACYRHPEKYAVLKQTRGNAKLISSGKAMPLGSRSEIESFLEKLDQFREEKKKHQNKTGKEEQLRMI